MDISSLHRLRKNMRSREPCGVGGRSPQQRGEPAVRCVDKRGDSFQIPRGKRG